jgi:c-di-GMP-binding flagellar brake protein YcgR
MSDSDNRRRFIRHPVSIPLKVCQASTEHETSSLNISQGGLLFSHPETIAEGEELEIAIPSLRSGEPVLFRTRVVRCEYNETTGMHDIGVAFYGEEDALRVRMLEQVLLIEAFRKLFAIPDFNQAATEWIKKYSDRFPEI